MLWLAQTGPICIAPGVYRYQDFSVVVETIMNDILPVLFRRQGQWTSDEGRHLRG